MFEKQIVVPDPSYRVSDLFRELQDIAGDATVAWHATGAELLEHGLMWVVVRYEVNLLRQLLPGESLRLVTWASPIRHRLSQRNYLAYDTGGDCVLRAAGIWAVVDYKTRIMVDPDEHKVPFFSEITGLEPPRPSSPAKILTDYSENYTVTEDVLDINGHMNNARYFDVAQDVAGDAFDIRQLKQVRALFVTEARAGDTITVHRGRDGSQWYFFGVKSGEPCFQISLAVS